MKMRVLLMLFLGSIVCLGADYSKELAMVKSGKTQTARAEWWGYNSKDCTESLQRALNSGVKKLIISKQASPWLTRKTLVLPSNIEIIFEDGAEIKAAEGCFKGIVDCLLKARSRKNIILRGKGILTMRKADYHNPKKYKSSEHRHTLGLYSSENIKIDGLTMQKSGGDGIYVNKIKNLLVDNVILDDHLRQGISVISAENLLIKNSVIKNTSGMAPQCGIDFEPNYAYEVLKNCRVVNCRFENNHHSAVNVSLSLKGEFDHPADIVVENCVVDGGNFAFSSMIPGRANEAVGTLRQGRFLIKNCKIKNTKSSAFYFQSHRTDGEKVIIENCTIDNPETKVAPIFFLVRPPAVGDFGGIEFKNCVINAPKAETLLDYITLMPQCKLTDIRGNITFNKRKINLKAYSDAKSYQNNPLMLEAYIPLLGFNVKSISDLKIIRFPDFWWFKLDPEKIGEREKWQNAPPAQIKKWDKVAVGKHWEKARSSSSALRKKLRTYNGIAWYAQKFKTPKSWKGRRIYIYFGALDESAKFFLNGKLAGERLHETPYHWILPFSVRIDKNIDWDAQEQWLSIPVTDTQGAEAFGKQSGLSLYNLINNRKRVYV